MSLRTPLARRFQVLAAVLAGTFHITSVVTAGVLTADHDSLQFAISDLGMAHEPYRWLVNLGGMAVPEMLLTVSVLLLTPVQPKRMVGWMGITLLASVGCLLVVAGAVPFPSPVHLAAALAAGLAGAAGIATFSAWISSVLNRRVWFATGLACAGLLIVTAVLIVLERIDPRFMSYSYLGLQQRTASFTTLMWFAACSVALRRRDHPKDI